MVVALVCGGGNGAHVCAGLAGSKKDVEVRVLSLYASEAEQWASAMEGHHLTVTLHSADSEPTKIHSKSFLVTKDPAKAMPNVNIIIFAVPAFAHAQYLEVLKPYIQPGLILAGCPGQAGFEFAIRGIWGELAKKVTIMSFESLPWACRITEKGRAVEVLGTKGTLTGAVQMGHPKPPTDPTETLQMILGEEPKLITTGHLLGITLMGTNGYLHPSIMYGRWHNWDGQPVSEPPLFYSNVDPKSAELLSEISDEVVVTAKSIMAQRPEVDLSVSHILDWYRRCYPEDIADKSSLCSCIQTNRAYKGLKHPCEETKDGLHNPNFGYRYLTEDIPYGLLVMRGIAGIAGVETPKMDLVIDWAQQQLGKEFIVDGQLTGKDLKSTRCPQKYGLNTLDEILGLA